VNTLNGVTLQAPRAVRPDLQTVAFAYEALSHEIALARGNAAKILAYVSDVRGSARFATAIARLKQYSTNVCHLPVG
jgi:hypothetical protein